MFENDEELAAAQPPEFPETDIETDSFDEEVVDQSAEEEKKSRSLQVLGVLGAVMLCCGLFIAGAVNSSGDGVAQAASPPDSATVHRQVVPPSALVLSHMRLVDTVYTLDSVYLNVNLKRQIVTVQFRNGTYRTFRISSGNPNISEGIATPTGLFTVQNMVPMAISKQFNDARLHHWIGIQGGVGFHGLDGSGYYGYLGVRPSSHGCVRMSREEIAEMYKLVHPGAMILVHSENPGRVVAFAQPTDTMGGRYIDSASVYNRTLGRERLQALMEGNYWNSSEPPLVHRAGQRLRWGLSIGDVRKIPRQKPPKVESYAALLATPRIGADRSYVNQSALLVEVQESISTSLERERKAHRAESEKPEYGE